MLRLLLLVQAHQDFPFNKTIELVFTNMGGSGFSMHPVHLHGNSFHVMKIGYPPFDEATGRVCVFHASTRATM